MFCRYCGAQIHDNDETCPYCGAGQTSPSSAGAAKEVNTDTTETVNTDIGMDGTQNTEYTTESASNPFTDNQASAFENTNSNNYNQDNYYNAPHYGQKLQTDRNLIVVILLSLVTCGIYSYYYTYKLAHDVNIACAGDGESTTGLLEFILLSLVTCGIYTYIWYYKLGDRLYRNAPRYGLTFTENGTTILIWLIFGYFLCGVGPFVALHIINKNTNAICEAYNIYNHL